jgi:secreted Zn-dependent insulinase-like peptidase
MNKDTYPAETANLDCSLDTTERGFSIEVKGINDKLEILLQTVLNHLEAFEDNLEDYNFEALLKQQKQDYYNRLIDPSNLSYDVKQFMRRDIYRW